MATTANNTSSGHGFPSRKCPVAPALALAGCPAAFATAGAPCRTFCRMRASPNTISGSSSTHHSDRRCRRGGLPLLRAQIIRAISNAIPASARITSAVAMIQ